MSRRFCCSLVLGIAIRSRPSPLIEQRRWGNMALRSFGLAQCWSLALCWSLAFRGVSGVAFPVFVIHIMMGLICHSKMLISFTRGLHGTRGAGAHFFSKLVNLVFAGLGIILVGCKSSEPITSANKIINFRKKVSPSTGCATDQPKGQQWGPGGGCPM